MYYSLAVLTRTFLLDKFLFPLITVIALFAKNDLIQFQKFFVVVMPVFVTLLKKGLLLFFLDRHTSFAVFVSYYLFYSRVFIHFVFYFSSCQGCRNFFQVMYVNKHMR